MLKFKYKILTIFCTSLFLLTLIIPISHAGKTNNDPSFWYNPQQKDYSSTNKSQPDSSPSSPIQLKHTVNGNTINLNWKLLDGSYLYKNKLDFKLENAPNVTMEKIKLPKAETINDPFFGIESIYKNALNLKIKLNGKSQDNSKLYIRYQGCNENLCFPPEAHTIKINVNNTFLQDDNTNTNDLSKSVKTNSYTSYGLILNLLALFGLGLLLSFTPCVLPMIPILTGIIIGQSKNKKYKNFALSSTYVLGMALTYAALGVVIASIGSSIQAAFQSPIAIIVSAIIFILMSLSMFGAFNIQLPECMRSFIHKRQTKQKAGTYIGAFLMGVLATLVISPCTTAPLIGVLTYIAQTGDIVYGAIGLFVLAIGMGVPLILIGIGFGRIVPKTGIWMNKIKHLFGFIMLGMAIWILQRILPPLLIQLLAGILIISFAIFNEVFHKAISTYQKAIQCILIVLMLYGVSLFVGVMMGNNNYYNPISITNNSSPNFKKTENQDIWYSAKVDNILDLNKKMKLLSQNHKIIILDFYAEWCSECQLLSKRLAKPETQNFIKKNGIAIIKVDVTGYNENTTKLLKYYKVLGMPTLIVLAKDLKEINRLSGLITLRNIKDLTTTN